MSTTANHLIAANNCKKTIANNERNHRMEEGRIDEPKQNDMLAYDATSGISCIEVFLLMFSCLWIICTFPITIWFQFREIQQYERGVKFRFGKRKQGAAEQPGIHFMMPFVEEMIVLDLRTRAFDVPPQQILTKDSVSVNLDAVVYFHIVDPVKAACNVRVYDHSTRLLATTTMRTILGTKTMDELLMDRENIAIDIYATMDEPVRPWGVQIERVELKDVVLPVNLQRAMAAEAEAIRDAKAKIVAAKGEQDASRALTEAASIISESPGAMQLRYLQTLHAISAEKNSTIIFPLPMDILSALTNFKAP